MSKQVSVSDEALDGADLSARPSNTLYLAVLLCLLSPLLFGFSLGFTSPSTATMDFVGTDGEAVPPEDLVVFDHTNAIQASAFASIINIGCMIGAFLGAVFSDRYGRKVALAISAVPMMIAYPCIALSSDWILLTSLRLLMGVGVGIGSAVAPCYIGEVSTLKLRGALGACNQLSVTIGILFANLFGTFVFMTGESGEFCQWRQLALLGAAFAVCLLSVLCIPESPLFYAKHGNLESTRASLTKLRTVSGGCEEELRDIIRQTPALQRAAAGGEAAAAGMLTSEQSPQSLADNASLGNPRYRKSLVVGIGLLVLQQFSGANAVIFYVSPICKSAGMANANLSGTVAMAAQVVFTLIACMVMEKAGRRFFLVLSMSLCALAHLGLGCYFLAVTQGLNPPSSLALAAISVYIIGFSFGLGPIPWLIIAELFPTEVRGSAASVATATNWGCSFLVTLCFSSLEEAIGNAGTFFLFAIIVVLSIVLTLAVVPETRGKNIQEVLAMMNNEASGLEPKSLAKPLLA